MGGKAHMLPKHLPEIVERYSHLRMFEAQVLLLDFQRSPKHLLGLSVSALVENTKVVGGVDADKANFLRCEQRLFNHGLNFRL